ncbi:ATP-binding protein [Olsenella sp. oral taxon 807]|uniref:ATP-binding protein n=1 Tax=Olsenella sp. oral taxon 807 TaxID=712411 RepID=UPI00155D941D
MARPGRPGTSPSAPGPGARAGARPAVSRCARRGSPRRPPGRAAREGAAAAGRPTRELVQLARAGPPGTAGPVLLPPDAGGARLLFQVISESHGRQSLVTTTNPGSGRWGAALGDDRTAVAAVGRVCHHGRLPRSGGESRRAGHAPVSGKGAARRRRGMASCPGAPVATSPPPVTPDARRVTCPTTPCPRQGATDSPVTGQSTCGWRRCAVTAPMRWGSSGARPSSDRMASPRGHRTGDPPVSVGRPGREAPDLGDRRPNPVRTLLKSWCDFCSILTV